MADGCIITKEIETNNGKWYQIMTMPYVQQIDHKNTGAIITFNDRVKQVLFSKKNLRSILFNLISNGIKFQSDKHPIIHIQTSMEGGHIILTVEDNGRGIPKEDINHIFDMYGRLHQDVEGRGIGLYLAKKIVNAAGGSIAVESVPGKGSTFIIYFKGESEL